MPSARAIAVAVAAAACLVTATCVYAVSGTGTGPGAARHPTVHPVVPLAGDPLPTSVDAAPAPLDAPAPCTATNLAVSGRQFQVATTMAVVTASVTNVSSSPCQLAGPALAVAAGDVLGLSIPATDPGGPAGAGAPVAPGSTVPLQVTVPDLVESGGTCTVNVAGSPVGTPATVQLPTSCAAPVQPGSAPPAPTLSLPGLGLPGVPAPSLPPQPPSVPSLPLPTAPPPPSAPSAPGTPALPPPPGGVPGPGLPGTPSLSGVPQAGPPGLPALPSLPGQSPPPSQPSSSPPPPPPARYSSGSTGYDISWPQCGGSYPPQSSVAVVGVNDGKAFTTNPCVTSEASWAGGALDLYMNLNSPTGADGSDSSGPAGNCGSNDSCLAYNYGYNAAQYSLGVARSDHLAPRMWWLDIETVGGCTQSFPTGGSGYWSCNQGLNSLTIQGALDAIRSAGAQVGVYSTSYQWGVITAGYNPSGGAPPNWLAGDDASPPSSWCDGSHDFGGGAAWLLQLYPSQTWDQDQAC